MHYNQNSIEVSLKLYSDSIPSQNLINLLNNLKNDTYRLKDIHLSNFIIIPESLMNISVSTGKTTRITIQLDENQLNDFVIPPIIYGNCEFYFLLNINFNALFHRSEAIQNIKNFVERVKSMKATFSYTINRDNINFFIQHTKKIIDLIDQNLPISEFSFDFFRQSEDENVDLNFWFEEFSKNIQKENMHQLIIPSLNNDYTPFARIDLIYSNGRLFLATVIFEKFISTNRKLELKKLSVSALEDLINKTTTNQLIYAQETDECAQCTQLNFCISKNILTYQQNKQRRDCIFPLKIKSLFK